MHLSALRFGKLFFESYCSGLQGAVVHDIGAQNVNGSLKDVLPPNLGYVGVDFVAGKGVDIILEDPYRLPFADASLDVIVCSSCFEHSQFFWLVFLEMLRVLKPEGLLYLNMPSNGSFHRYPVDCWRFYPDSGRALEAWGARNGYSAQLLESFVGERSGESYESGGAWHDFVAIFVKDAQHAGAYPARMLDAMGVYANGYDSRTGAESHPEFLSPDHVQLVARERSVDALRQQLAQADAERAALLARYEQQVASLSRELAAEQARASSAQVRIDQILHSRSWKLMAPARKMLGAARTVRSTMRSIAGRLGGSTADRAAAIQALIRASGQFDESFYRSADPDLPAGTDPVAHYCAQGWQEGRDPSAGFSTRYYLDANPDIHAAGINPFAHYLLAGAAEQRKPRPDAVVAGDAPRLGIDAQVAAIRASGLFDEGYYHARYPEVPRTVDAVRHYCERGWREGRNPSSAFDTSLYLERSPHLRDAGTNPLLHFLAAGLGEARVVRPPWQKGTSGRRREARLAAEVVAIRQSGLFDEAYYRAANTDLQPPPADAIRHYCEHGWRDGRDPSREFSTSYYLATNPDIREAGMNPFWHFVTAGRSEQRLARPQGAPVKGDVAFDTDRATVLVVSHEASLTGAPVLSLNIVQGLRRKYNVVSLLLGPGPLATSFRQESVAIAGPVKDRYSAEAVGDAIAQLADAYPFAFAVVNSIEAATVLEPLARRSVPTVALIHEFASYVRPRTAFRNTFFWADEVVFSTRLTHANALAAYPELASKHCHIVPQGRCLVLPSQGDDAWGREQELQRVRSILRPPGAEGSMLVVGMGYVHIRKGVDHFLDCAARVLKANPARACRFVWVGQGYDPERDMAYSVYLADQIQRSGLTGHVEFMGDTREIDEVYAAADLLLLTSRLDPLPNVAIDAMATARPVFCFDKTTGIAEILADNGMGEQCVAGYLDDADLAAKVVAVANSEELRRRIGARMQEIATATFDMGRYLQALEDIAGSARERVGQERACAEVIATSVQLHDDYVTTHVHADTPLDAVRWKYVRPWSSGILPRKPFPGFHPGVFGEHQGHVGKGDLLAHYIRAGQPDGPWKLDVISAADTAAALDPALRVALHLHVYYPDMLQEMLSRLALNRVRPTLLVSVPSEAARAQVTNLLARYEGASVVEVVPNRGRDIAPFLTAFGTRIARDFDLVGHLHTKKTADVADASMAQRWREFLLENLLGGKAAMADIILGRMAADPSIGMVFPDDPHAVGWGGNLEHARPLARRLGLQDDMPRQFVFPIGTMFWARVDAIRPLLALGLDWPDYPPEPLPYDGSMLHAIERILPFVASQQGQRIVLTNVPGVTR